MEKGGFDKFIGFKVQAELADALRRRAEETASTMSEIVRAVLTRELATTKQ